MDHVNALIHTMDETRAQSGFMILAQIMTLAQTNTIYDPFSTLISASAQIGRGNMFYPGTIIEIRNQGMIVIGDENSFFVGTSLLADHGNIQIGSRNELGDGGLRIKANTPDVLIMIADNGRYRNNAEITGRCTFGSGTQVLGAIAVLNCTLGAGDSYRDPDPEQRGGVLKGFGNARNLTVPRGQVINGLGIFSQSALESQLVYHPRNK